MNLFFKKGIDKWWIVLAIASILLIYAMLSL